MPKKSEAAALSVFIQDAGMHPNPKLVVLLCRGCQALFF